MKDEFVEEDRSGGKYIPPVTADLLMSWEAECCRAHQRHTLWNPRDADCPMIPLGRMLNQLFDKRVDFESTWTRSERSANKWSRLSKNDWVRRANALSSSSFEVRANTLGRFLDGGVHEDRHDVWGQAAPHLLRVLLQGSHAPGALRTASDSNASSSEAPASSGSPFWEQWRPNDPAERIIQFFFPKSRLRQITNSKPGVSTPTDRVPKPKWFADPAYRHRPEPIGTCEAIAEMRALLYHARHGARSTIVRISGGPRFVQANSVGQLTDSGLMTLECLAGGVTVAFVYPDPEVTGPSAASTGLEAFLTVARSVLSGDATKRLLVKPLKPWMHVKSADGRQNWSGELLSSSHRWIAHDCRLPESAKDYAVFQKWSALMLSRQPKHGPCAYLAEADEISAAFTWIQTFVPELSMESAAPPLVVRST